MNDDSKVCTTLCFGVPKLGKTCLGASTHPRMLWIGNKDNIDTAVHGTYGFHPAVYTDRNGRNPVNDLDDLERVLDKLAPRAQDYGALGIDDITHLAKVQVGKNEAASKAEAIRRSREEKKRINPNTFAVWSGLSQSLLRIDQCLRNLGIFAHVVSHERGPGTDDKGYFHKGGPQLGSKSQVLEVPSWFDVNLRVVPDKDYPDPWLRTAMVAYPFDADWVTGDRHSVLTGVLPPNLREMLRASGRGYKLQRLSGLDWQDEVADQIASEVISLGTAPRSEVLSALRPTMSRLFGGTIPAFPQTDKDKHIRWAIQDGIARGIIHLRRNMDVFDLEEAMANLPGADVAGLSSNTDSGDIPPPPPSE